MDDNNKFIAVIAARVQEAVSALECSIEDFFERAYAHVYNGRVNRDILKHVCAVFARTKQIASEKVARIVDKFMWEVHGFRPFFVKT